MSEEPDDKTIRLLREAIYDPISDKEWLLCQAFWSRPENAAWLRQQPENQDP